MNNKQDRIYLSDTNRQMVLDKMEELECSFTQAINDILTNVANKAQGDFNGLQTKQ